MPMERAGRGRTGRIRRAYAGRREARRSQSGDPSESTEARQRVHDFTANGGESRLAVKLYIVPSFSLFLGL